MGREEGIYYISADATGPIDNLLQQLVEGDSAIIGDARERRDTVHANHVNIVKFSDAKDNGYLKVLHAIKTLLNEKSTWIQRPAYSILTVSR